jgi:L-rhamnose mutarotase
MPNGKCELRNKKWKKPADSIKDRERTNMETKVFVARLRADRKEDYIEAHNGFSSELRARYRAAGIHQIRLFLLGEQLFMYVEAENYELARAALSEDPLDRMWQERVGPMKSPDFQPLVEIFRLD